jgi:hypothetical protein
MYSSVYVWGFLGCFDTDLKELKQIIHFHPLALGVDPADSFRSASHIDTPDDLRFFCGSVGDFVFFVNV